MRRIRRLFVFFLILCLTLTACAPKQPQAGASFEQMKYTRPDVDAIHTTLDEALEAADAGDEQVLELYQQLMDQLLQFDDNYALATIRNYLDLDDTYYEDEVAWLDEQYTILDNRMLELTGRILDSSCGPAAREAWGEDFIARYESNAQLNAPENHPSRDWTDTFYLKEDSSILLRSQTSPMQIRAMEGFGVPIRMISAGRVYRKDEVDATHSPMFHQIEGLVVDKGITMADLKGTLNEVIREIYGRETVTRFRPHHFPFTEPSCEVDIQCYKCGGKGCPTCKGEGWIELLGAGMVHPNVLRNCGIDPDEYSGYAFGMGLERLALGRYKISDMRLIFENDMRFLEQF